MSDQAERIRAALLRFKAAQPGEGSGETGQPEPERQLVIVDERNLAALLPQGVNLRLPEAERRAQASGKRS